MKAHKHFFITQIINIIFIIIVLAALFGSLEKEAREELYLALYLLPLIIISWVCLYIFVWKSNSDCFSCIWFVSVICFCVCGGLFFGLFFNRYYRPITYDFKKAKAC